MAHVPPAAGLPNQRAQKKKKKKKVKRSDLLICFSSTSIGLQISGFLPSTQPVPLMPAPPDPKPKGQSRSQRIQQRPVRNRGFALRRGAIATPSCPSISGLTDSNAY
jgi:hypothetical protein